MRQKLVFYLLVLAVTVPHFAGILLIRSKSLGPAPHPYPTGQGLHMGVNRRGLGLLGVILEVTHHNHDSLLRPKPPPVSDNSGMFPVAPC